MTMDGQQTGPRSAGDFLEIVPGQWLRAGAVVDVRRVDEEGAGEYTGAGPEQGRRYLTRLTTEGRGAYWSIWPVEAVLSVLGNLDAARWASKAGEGR
jgi:hypothetical protein